MISCSENVQLQYFCLSACNVYLETCSNMLYDCTLRNSTMKNIKQICSQRYPLNNKDIGICEWVSPFEKNKQTQQHPIYICDDKGIFYKYRSKVKKYDGRGMKQILWTTPGIEKINTYFLNVFCQQVGSLMDRSQDWCLTFLHAATQRQSEETMSCFSRLVGWLVGLLTSSSTTRLYRGRAPRQERLRQERLTILRAATHETELGDHGFCFSRSHYTDTDPISSKWFARVGIELLVYWWEAAHSTNWATEPTTLLKREMWKLEAGQTNH